MGVGEPEAMLDEQDTWRGRPAIAALVRLAVVAFPVAISIGVAMAIELSVSEPASALGRAAWWIAVLGSSSVALLACERIARKALPLAALLKMGMLFPGVAPKRLAVARRAASTRDLERQLEEARSQGIDDEPVIVAERIVALAASLSAHDRKTRGHTERVRALTDLVADELGLSETDRDKLRWSALLHDVGKLAVHPDILNKAGALSDDEWEVIRQHPLEGARLTAPLADWLGEWASTIAEHHERYDGRGYPYGLAGDAISLGGRIVAVVDTYDVMTSVRSYKRPSSPEMARMELARCAGTQFDPVVVRAFLAVPVRRLRSLLPLSWLGSLPFGFDFGPGLAVVGRTAVAFVAAGSVVGLTASSALGSQIGAAAGSGPTAGPNGQFTGGGSPGSPASGSGASSGGSGSHGSNGKASVFSGLFGNGSGSAGGAAGFPGDRSSSGSGPGGTDGGSGDPGGQGTSSGGGGGSTGTSATSPNGPGTTYPGIPPTTFPWLPPTTYPGSPPTTVPGSPPTTSGGSPTTTTTSPPPPTTTTTTAPAPVPPTGVHATGSCQVLIIGPEVTVSWTHSTSSGITGYEILRKSGSTYQPYASVSSSATQYVDTGVSGINTSYSYEIETVTTNGTSGPSASASGTTPPLCL